MDGYWKQCREVVRRGSPDRYIATLYAPVEKRGALFALYAFDTEISQIRHRASEPLPGEIRLQWWRDVLDGQRAEEARAHPTAAALIDTIVWHKLPQDALDRFVEAHIFDLYDDGMPNRNDLEGYCGETSSMIFQLAALMLDPKASHLAADAAGHAGIAYCLAGVRQSLVSEFAYAQKFVPNDILDAAGIDRQGFGLDPRSEAAANACAMVLALASDHMTKFRACAANLPRQLASAFLPMAPIDVVIKRMNAGTTGRQSVSPAGRQLKILWRALRGW